MYNIEGACDSARLRLGVLVTCVCVYNMEGVCDSVRLRLGVSVTCVCVCVYIIWKVCVIV